MTGRPTATADEGVEAVRKLVAELQIPALGRYGIGVGHIAEVVEKSAQASSMKANPIVLKPEELAEVLQRAI